MIESDGIIYGYGNGIYKIGDAFYREAIGSFDLKLNIVEIPRITPTNWAGVTMNNLGHFEGEIGRIEEFQSEKLRNNIDVGTNLSTYLQKIKRKVSLKKIDSTLNARNNKCDLLIIDNKLLAEQIGPSFSGSAKDLFAFSMYDGDTYVGIEVIDNWPTMLTLQVTFHNLINYLKQEGLYEDRWPYTHIWQNGIEFAHLAPLIHTENFRIWSTSYFQSLNGLFLRDVMYPKLGPNDYVLISDWGTVYPASSCLISKAKHKNNIFWCVNGEVELENLKKGGIKQAHIISHNAFVDHTTFAIKKIAKKYDAIFCQTVIPFKRPGLTSMLDRVVYSTGNPPAISYQQMIASRNNELMIASTPHQVATLMNQSHCGLSLSMAEGGNYATTEYLLCGIPVVNTKNVGGRDTYLDETNSILAQEDTSEEIARCVKYLIDNKDKYDPVAIREGALRRNNEMIQTLKTQILYPICSSYGVSNQVVDKFVADALNNGNPSSKGRTVFQSERSLMKI